MSDHREIEKDSFALAIECAAGPLSVALFRGGELLFSSGGVESVAKVSELSAAVRSVLARGGISAEQLDAVAVSIGPGSYTGIRAGISFVRGMRSGSGVATRMVPLTFAMAGTAVSEGSIGTAVKVGRNETAIEIVHGMESVSLEIVATESLNDASIRLAAKYGVSEWIVDQRLESHMESSALKIAFVKKRFAELIGATPVDGIPSDESRYLASKFK